MLSFHRTDSSGYPNAGYLWRNVSSLDELSNFVTQKVWSPVIWAGGSRGAVKFRCARWCVLDYDDTLSKREAENLLEQFPFLLGPTKSDGIEKVSTTGARKPARDRFRVVIPFSQTIWDRDVFEYNMRLVTKRFNADLLPYDAGRVWQPCKSVECIWHNATSSGLDVTLTIPVEETQQYKQQQLREKLKARKAAGIMSPVVKRFILGRIRPAERNDMLFKAACYFFEKGETVDQFRKRVYAMPAMSDHDKIESTIKSAAKRTGASYF